MSNDKSLGQIAFEAFDSDGVWETVSRTRRDNWERAAEFVAEAERERLAKIHDYERSVVERLRGPGCAASVARHLNAAKWLREGGEGHHG
jgi:hypothetical protein